MIPFHGRLRRSLVIDAAEPEGFPRVRGESTVRERYLTGEYQQKNPTWHVEDSPWKAALIARMLEKNRITPTTVCEIGCGAGEILNQLQKRLDPRCTFWGYEISPQAFELCQTRANDRLHFRLRELPEGADATFDLILVIDLLEHLPDYSGFLRTIRSRSRYKIFHIPLEISVQAVLRAHPFSRARASVGHIHFFTREIALDALEDAGYEILDSFYTTWSADLRATTVMGALAKIPRRLLFRMHEGLASRLLGGFSLMVLAK